MNRFAEYQKKYKRTLWAAEFIGSALVVLYSSWQIGATFQGAARGFVLTAVLAVSVLCVGFQTYTRHRETHTFHPLYHTAVVASGLYTAFLTYHIIALVVVQLLFTILKHTAGISDRRPFLAAAAIGALGTVCGGNWRAHRICTVNLHVKMSRWKSDSPYRVVHLSDLHIGAAVSLKHLEKMVRDVNACQPDLIVITGDILNHGGTYEVPHLERVMEVMRRMQARDGVFGVMGNHDLETSDPNLEEFFSGCGIQMIDNRTVSTGTVNLVGRTGILLSGGRVRLDRLMETADPELPVIILDHDPKGIEEAVRCNADLVLCGHTHAGQFFPCTVLTRVIYGKKGARGFARIKGTASVVSAGTGYFQTPIRVGTDNEIVCITLGRTGA